METRRARAYRDRGESSSPVHAPANRPADVNLCRPWFFLSFLPSFLQCRDFAPPQPFFSVVFFLFSFLRRMFHGLSVVPGRGSHPWIRSWSCSCITGRIKPWSGTATVALLDICVSLWVKGPCLGLPVLLVVTVHGHVSCVRAAVRCAVSWGRGGAEMFAPGRACWHLAANPDRRQAATTTQTQHCGPDVALRGVAEQPLEIQCVLAARSSFPVQ